MIYRLGCICNVYPTRKIMTKGSNTKKAIYFKKFIREEKFKHLRIEVVVVNHLKMKFVETRLN